MVIGAAVLPFGAHAQVDSDMAAFPVSAAESAIHIDPTTVVADGAHDAVITVYVRDRYETLIPGKNVRVTLSKKSGVLAQGDAVTDETGHVEFKIRSVESGLVTVSATVDGIELMSKPTVSFVDPPPCALASNVVIKLSGSSDEGQAYYYGRDCKRHAFQEKAFGSWFGDTSSATDVGAEQLASMPLGYNVSFKPGSLIKFQSGSEIYAVSRGGVLRHVSDEAVAAELYGDNWSDKVTTISDAFYINYEFGDDVTSAEDYDPVGEWLNTPTIGDNI